MSSIQNFDYNGGLIQRRDDGFINLTQMCQANKKRLDNWHRLNSTRLYIEAVSSDLGIPASQLLVTNKGNSPGLIQGSWGHPRLAEHLQRWIDATPSKSTGRIFEVSVQTALAEKIGGSVEVKVQTGRVDILTDSEVIEVKDISQWKSAVGQVLVYAIEFPRHSPRIHLYGKSSDQFKYMICSYCQKLGVVVTFDGE